MDHIIVTVFPDSPKNKVLQSPEGTIQIFTRSPAKENRANEEARMLLADFLGISTSQLYLTKGHRQRKKIFNLKSNKPSNLTLKTR